MPRKPPWVGIQERCLPDALTTSAATPFEMALRFLWMSEFITLCVAEPSHPSEKTHFGDLYSGPWSQDHRVRTQMAQCLSSLQQFETIPSLLLMPHQSANWTHAPLSHYLCIRSQDAMTPSVRATSLSNREPWLQTWTCDFHPSCLTLGCKPLHCMLKFIASWR